MAHDDAFRQQALEAVCGDRRGGEETEQAAGEFMGRCPSPGARRSILRKPMVPYVCDAGTRLT